MITVAAPIFNESVEETAKKFHSNICTSEKYAATRLRTKLNCKGQRSCKFYESPSRLQKTYDAFDLKASSVRPFLQLKGIWQQGGQWGLQIEVLSLFIAPGAEAPCPF